MHIPLIRERQVKSVLTRSNLPVSDYSANPYVGCTHGCRYCYASFMKRFTNHPEPWGAFLDVKYWPEIQHPKRYAGKELFLGSVTDPYLPQEETYRRTRALLEQLQGSGVKLSIATKSDLVLRDLELIKTFPNARVSWSINTLEEGFKNDMDRAVSIQRRLAAMEAFHRAGVRTTCFVSPIFPGITDVKAIIQRVKGQCNLIWLENLNLRGNYKRVIMAYIQEKHPELSPLYGEIYHQGDRSYWESLDAELKAYAAEMGLPYVINDDSMQRPFASPPVMVNYFFHEQIKNHPRRAVAIMPELPEVEAIRRVMEPQIQGLAVEHIAVGRPEVIAHPAADTFCNRLIGQTFSGMTRRGKFLIILLESGDRMILHLRMTGCLLLTPADYPEEKHTHLVFRLHNGEELRFSDTRRFGRFWLLGKGEADPYSGVEKLGLEPLAPDFSAEYLFARLGKRKKAIKECLMEQSVIAGIGNIYSDEILFAARICPTRPANSLTGEEWKRLAAAIPERLSFFIQKNAMTPEEYLKTRGRDYRGTPYLQVYGHEGEPCPNCGKIQIRTMIGGRSSVYCPNCQE